MSENITSETLSTSKSKAEDDFDYSDVGTANNVVVVSPGIGQKTAFQKLIKLKSMCIVQNKRIFDLILLLIYRKSCIYNCNRSVKIHKSNNYEYGNTRSLPTQSSFEHSRNRNASGMPYPNY